MKSNFITIILIIVIIFFALYFFSGNENFVELVREIRLTAGLPVSAEPTSTPNPCLQKLDPNEYPNPHANLDPETEMTYLVLEFEPGVLSSNDIYHFWWDARAFMSADSFSIGDGPCEVLLESNQIRCENIPLSGVNEVTTGKYDYSFSLSWKHMPDCISGPAYLQKGVIDLETLEDDVFIVNGDDVP